MNNEQLSMNEKKDEGEGVFSAKRGLFTVKRGLLGVSGFYHSSVVYLRVLGKVSHRDVRRRGGSY